MSDRDHGKGSSRSTRDDSRWHKERQRTRTRSRSPRRTSLVRTPSPPKFSKTRDKDDYHKRKPSPENWEDEEVPAPPPPPRISKITMGFSKPKAPIKMTIGSQPKPAMAPKPTLASVFNPDEDDEPEEMPAEARMRMRNIGRETPTSAGPNSFGKTKQGFCDAKKVFEKNLKQALETADKPNMMKLPQTIYKLKAP